MTPEIDGQTWLATFQQLLHHYLPQLPNTPLVNVGSFVALGIGLLLVFRGNKFSRFFVCSFALVLGAWVFYRLSLFIGTPAPISAAFGGVLLTVVAYRTHRWWLAVGSVLVLFGVAVVFQVARGDLRALLPTAEQVSRAVEAGKIELPPTAEEQLRNLHPSRSDELIKAKDKVLAELKDMGPVGWIVPIGAAIIGGLLAFWALSIFAVVWMAFLGANVFVLAAATLLCTHWPRVQTALIAQPKILAGLVIGLWLLGLVLQAKEARLPKKKPAKESAKS